jgi:RNA polymerase sigma-70 factor, ECF subfamily
MPSLTATEFEAERPHLLAVAYRMLGSRAEAEDAVQEAWLRYAKARDGGEIHDLRGWLTTVTGRICLDVLRRRGGWCSRPGRVYDLQTAMASKGESR